MNTQSIRDQAKIIEGLQADLIVAINARNAVNAVSCGQSTAGMSIAGINFTITSLNNYYVPEAIKGMERIQAECAALLQSKIDTIKSRLMGAENTLRRLVSKGS